MPDVHFLHTKSLYLYLLRKSAAFFCALLLSRPARGAWIEILYTSGISDDEGVAPRKGRVD